MLTTLLWASVPNPVAAVTTLVESPGGAVYPGTGFHSAAPTRVVDLITAGLTMLAGAGGLDLAARKKDRQSTSLGDLPEIFLLVLASIFLGVLGGLVLLVGTGWWLIERVRVRKARQRYRTRNAGG